MRFKIEVRHKGEEKTWLETYDEPCDDANKWAQETIEYFNSTLRPFEKERELVSVTVLENQVSEVDTDALKISEAHKTLDSYFDNGKKMANEGIYISHMKGLAMLGYNEAGMEKAANKVAYLAFNSFVDTFQLNENELETSLGHVEDDFCEGFVTQYMENFYSEIDKKDK